MTESRRKNDNIDEILDKSVERVEKDSFQTDIELHQEQDRLFFHNTHFRRTQCRHLAVMPEWDLAEAKRIQAAGGSVRARFPRKYVVCSECGWEGVLYASTDQYIMGDY